MLILGIDFETTSLDIESLDVIEIGAVLWDTEKRKPVKFLSELIRTHQLITDEITSITGITSRDISLHGIDLLQANSYLTEMWGKADVACAHNVEFDKPIFEKKFKKQIPLDWIDTKTDLPIKAYGKSSSLTYLAADHGFLNPFAHRALFDVLTMLKVLDLYPIEEVINRSKSPIIELDALVSFENKDLAKNEGFRWEPSKKQWLKEVKECDLSTFDFQFKTKQRKLS